MNFAPGLKTKAIAVIGVLLGIYTGLQPYYNLPPIPGFIYVVLAFTGLYTTRSGITTDTQKAVTDVMAQITVPQPASVTVVADTATVTASQPVKYPNDIHPGKI